MRGRADGQREQAADRCDPGELAVEGADQDVDVEGDDHASEHRIGDDRAPAHAGGQRAPEDGQQEDDAHVAASGDATTPDPQ